MNQPISRAFSKCCRTPCQLITQYNFLQRHISCVWIIPEMAVGTCWWLNCKNRLAQGKTKVSSARLALRMSHKRVHYRNYIKVSPCTRDILLQLQQFFNWLWPPTVRISKYGPSGQGLHHQMHYFSNQCPHIPESPALGLQTTNFIINPCR